MVYNINEVRKKMQATEANFLKQLSGLRTGRASTELLNGIMVEAYGKPTPINQIGNINIPEPRMLLVQVWDKSLVKLVEKAISESNLGVSPVSDGNLVRIPLPDLTEERRKELVKIASDYAEKSRVSVRNIRRDAMNGAKLMQKNGELSEDDLRRENDVIQKATDEFIKKIDDLLAKKEQDIMKI